MRAAELERQFPNLVGSGYEVKSEATARYNCIGWAAEDTDHWWWPFGQTGFAFWPRNAPRIETEEAFMAAFETIGYKLCAGSELEIGFTKVALYVRAGGRPTHMARQLPSGIWTSKLGRSVDIVHPRLEDIAGQAYGNARQVLKRQGGERSPGELRQLILQIAIE